MIPIRYQTHHYRKKTMILALFLLLLDRVYALNTKHSDAFVIPLYNRVNFIGCVVELGTPPQRFELLLDTGSSVSWVVGVENPHCFTSDKKGYHSSVRSNTGECVIHGTYNKTASKTWNGTIDTHGLSNKLEIGYFDKTKVQGVIGYDHLKIPTLTDSDEFKLGLEKFEFGIGEKTNSSVGILALGIPDFKYDKRKGTLKYTRQNLVTQATKNGIIDRSVFSIWLNDNSNNGELLIGSIDEAKFHAPLYTMKLINMEHESHPVERFSVILSDIKLQLPEGNSTRTVDVFEQSIEYDGSYTSVLLDTGAKFSYLPKPIYDVIANELTQYYDIKAKSDGHLLVDCGQAAKDKNNVSLGFQFNSHVFNIPIHSFLERAHSDSAELLRTEDEQSGKQFCSLGIIPQANNVSILGQAFFRSIYTVFDLDAMEVSMAPAKFTEKRSVRKITFQEGVRGIPDGLIDDDLKQPTVDPKDGFLLDTRNNGFYTYDSEAGIRFNITKRELILYAFSVLITYLLI